MGEDIQQAQRNELTEHYFYAKLKDLMKNQNNKAILERISQDELRHYQFWAKYSGKEVKPHRWRIRE